MIDLNLASKLHLKSKDRINAEGLKMTDGVQNIKH
jgi:hypothetical protein